MNMNAPLINDTTKQYVIAYMTLRKTIGWAGLLMPIAVHLGAYFQQGIPLANSISAYYYTGMRDEFVATLVLVGVLLACYRSPLFIDNVLASIAGIAAICIGLFPMSQKSACEILKDYSEVCKLQPHGPELHFYFVATFFALVFYLVYFRFSAVTSVHMLQKKSQRNVVYRICGLLMLVAFLTIGAMHLTNNDSSIFWPEAVAVMAFAAAWLVKGQIVLKG